MRSVAYQLEKVSVAQAFGSMFAIGVGIAPATEGHEVGGVVVTFPARADSTGGPITLRPGEPVDYPSAAGLPDRLAATFSTRSGITLAYVDPAGEASGPLVPVTSLDGETIKAGEPLIPLLSALVIQPQALLVYWIDRRSPGALWVAAANASGDAFGPKRVVLTESFSPEQPRVATLPDGRAVLFWIANRRGAQTLRAAPVLADGSLAAPSEITTGAFRDLRVVPSATGIAVGWFDEGAELLHGATVQCE